MITPKYEYKSDFARRYYRKGQEDVVLELLAMRYGQLSSDVEARVRGANPTDLDGIAQRLLTAKTLDEAVGNAFGAPRQTLAPPLDTVLLDY